MSGKGMYFFATRADMEAGIREIEAMKPLLYTAKGSFSAPQREFESALLLPDFGTLQNGHHSLEPAYLVMSAKQPTEVRKVPQNDGSVRYAIDQLQNPHSVVFQPSGIYNSSAIIMGALTTVSSHPDSLGLYNLFSQKIRQGFQKLKDVYVGPEALALAKQGYRLTNDINRPASYDTKI